MLFPRLVIMSCILVATTAATAADMEITPFRAFNQQPTIQIYGLPVDSSARLTQSGKYTVAFIQEIASNYTVSRSSNEQLVFDGEIYRSSIIMRYGISEKFEVGLNVPYIVDNGGFLDSFLIDWHSFFGMPQGGRDTATRGAVNYSYRKDGVQKLQKNRSGSGIGDISLNFGIKLHDLVDADSRQEIAFRGDLKLPTGEVAALRGSGSSDLALSFCGMTNSFTRWGTIGLFGSVGVLSMTDSRVLADQHNNVVGFGSAGVGWGPYPWISFKVQLNASTPFYKGSSLAELSKPSFMLITGGALKFPDNYQLDIGVSEDISVRTAPDVTFHFALVKAF